MHLGRLSRQSPKKSPDNSSMNQSFQILLKVLLPTDRFISDLISQTLISLQSTQTYHVNEVDFLTQLG